MANSNENKILYKELSYKLQRLFYAVRISTKLLLFVAISLLFVAISGLSVEAAQVYLLPQTADFGVDETFISELRLNTEGENLNAFDITILYPPDILEVVELIEGRSLINLWIERPSYSPEEGRIFLQGGRIGGFSGEGLLVKILFRGKETGDGLVTFAPSSLLLKHDGQGTPALGIFSAARYSLHERAAPRIEITSESHPDQDIWHQANVIDISWQSEEGLLYSYILSRDIIQNPDDETDEGVGSVVYTDPGDGVYYFSLKDSSDGLSWSSPTRYRILQDKTPPEPFEILIGQDSSVYEGKYFATFMATDATSGIDHYEIRENTPIGTLRGAGKWKVVESPYPLQNQKLRSIIKIKAVDKAGNERVVVYTPRTIRIVESIIFIILLLVTVIVVNYFWKRKPRI